MPADFSTPGAVLGGLTGWAFVEARMEAHAEAGICTPERYEQHFAQYGYMESHHRYSEWKSANPDLPVPRHINAIQTVSGMMYRDPMPPDWVLLNMLRYGHPDAPRTVTISPSQPEPDHKESNE